MSPGSTRTGVVLEAMILPALQQGGYSFEKQVLLGQRLGIGKHVVDAIAEKDGRKILISLKWQQVSGTAEQKVPFELICLLEALQAGHYAKAYLVLGGEGWTLRSFLHVRWPETVPRQLRQGGRGHARGICRPRQPRENSDGGFAARSVK